MSVNPISMDKLIARTKNPSEKNVLSKIKNLKDNMKIDSIGTINPDNFYRAGSYPTATNKSKVTMEIFQITDTNDPNLTHRKPIKSPGGRDIYDTAISYVVTPIGNQLSSGKIAYENVDLNKPTVRAFDPRDEFIAENYSGAVADLSASIKTQQELPFLNQFRALTYSGDLREIDNSYYDGLLKGVINSNPDYFPDSSQQQ